jgi:septum formation inhibitor MinC
MTTINATKGEFVNLINGLFQVQELKGKKFGLVISKNITTLKKELEHLEDLGKPSEEFMKLAQKVNEISTKDPENSKAEIDKLEKENEELVKLRREQMENVTELMKDTMSIKLKTVSEKLLPEDITAQQINNIEKIIK